MQCKADILNMSVFYFCLEFSLARIIKAFIKGFVTLYNIQTIGKINLLYYNASIFDILKIEGKNMPKDEVIIKIRLLAERIF